MAILKRISCIRPKPELVDRIASGPHSAMSSEEIRQKIQKNPVTYTRIVHPKFLYNERPKNTDDIYLRAAQNLEDWIREGIMIDDVTEGFYLYRMEYKGHRQTGIVGKIPVDEILANRVKAHEKVRENKLRDLAHHVMLCKAQIGGPILMSYRRQEAIDRWVENVCTETPLYHFLSENHVWNTIWKVEDEKCCCQIQGLFGEVDSLYIADGHHRIMSAVKICQDMREKNPDYTGDEPWNYVTCVCFPDCQLHILPYSRIVNDRCGYDPESLCSDLKKHFEISSMERVEFPKNKGDFVMLMDGRCWKLRLREGRRPEQLPDSLDVAILQQFILGPCFGIHNDRRDNRLEFMGGEDQIRKVSDKCGPGGSLGFLLYPSEMEDILQSADCGSTMPPKSTWFSPKMCNGLFIYRIFRRT